MRRLSALPVLLFAVLLAACGSSRAPSSSQGSQAAAATPAPAAAAPASESRGNTGSEAPAMSDTAGDVEQSGSTATGATENATDAQQPFDRLIVKSADISLQVVDVGLAETAIRTKVGALRGYVTEVQTSGTDDDLSSHITFRVPVERFDDALNGVEGLAKKVLNRTVSGDDVTEEFVDLDSRQRTLEATRDRLLTFLNQATKVQDALAVNQSITEIQGQLDQIQGRKQYLSQSAALSTITVSLLPVPAVQPLVTEEGWQPEAVARDALRGLLTLAQAVATVAIVILVWTPLWLPLLLLGLWLWRRAKGETKTKTSAA